MVSYYWRNQVISHLAIALETGHECLQLNAVSYSLLLLFLKLNLIVNKIVFQTLQIVLKKNKVEGLYYVKTHSFCLIIFYIPN